MQRVFVAMVWVSLLVLLAAGCSPMKSMLAEPEWSENYALEGECDVEQLNDGSMYTTGVTLPPAHTRGERYDDSRFSDAIITLKEPKEIKRIVVRRRSEDSAPVDLDIFAMLDGEWKEIKKVRGEVDDDIRIGVSTVTDKIKIRAQRATRTAKGKVAIRKSTSGARGRGRRAESERVLREPIKLAEIELYGVKAEKES